MNKELEIESFLKRLANIYRENDFEINEDIIYSELVSYNKGDKLQHRNLEEIMFKLTRVFGMEIGFRYWRSINVYGDCEYSDFSKNLRKATKLYVSLPNDDNEIYKIICKIWKFLIENNIQNQSKVSSGLRNDTLVIRVCEEKDLSKIIEFINSLEYNREIEPNPFLYHNKNVALTKDSGSTSYNQILSQVLESYIKEFGANLENINFNSFKTYVEKKSKEEANQKCYIEYQMLLKILNNTVDVKDFINGTLNLKKENTLDLDEKNLKVSDVEILETIIAKLKEYYEEDEIDIIIQKYIETGNLDYFTKKGNIRQVVSQFFDKKSFEKTMHTLVLTKLRNASYETYVKYGEGQLMGALERLYTMGYYLAFTNTNDAREELEDVCSHEFLIKVIDTKLKSMNMESDYNSLITYMTTEVEKYVSNVPQK